MHIKNFTGRKKMLSILAACVAVVAVAAVSLGMIVGGGGGGSRSGGAPGGAQMEETNTRIVVDLQNPSMGNIYVTGEFIGTVEPSQQVTVYPKASAEVVATYFNVGDTVAKGELLMELDAASLESNIAQKQASLTLSEAKALLSLEQAQNDVESYYSGIEEGYNSDLISAESKVRTEENNVQSASSTLWDARKTYRDAKSGEGGDYTDAEIDSLQSKVTQAEYSLESAQLSLEQAEANLEAVRKTVAEKESSVNSSAALAELNADFTEKQLELAQLENDLGDYKIASPISGIIEQRNVSQYDMASAQDAAYVISNKDAMTIAFNVTETNLSYMALGDSVTVEKNGETCTGAITEVATMVDSGSGLYTIKATVENAPFNLHTGSTVKIRATTKKAENDMMIPIDAVYYQDGSPYVYLYQDGHAVQAFVDTGISDADYIQITAGLSLSDRFISTWSPNLMNGAEVFLAGSEEAAEPETADTNNGTDTEDAEPPSNATEGVAR